MVSITVLFHKKSDIQNFYFPDSKLKVNSNCPISVLPSISKIYEKLFHTRLMSFLTHNKIIHKHEFGFQKGKSTENATLDINTSILKALEKKSKACSIF